VQVAARAKRHAWYTPGLTVPPGVPGLRRPRHIRDSGLIGTIMVANVFMIIIPNQRRVVADLIAGRTPDPRLGAAGKQRSVHNNYLTLPVVFVMISNHYPLAFATRFNWLILALVMIMGALIRHFYNSRHKGLPSPWWTWGVTICGRIAAFGFQLR
jgi:uncharacterized membrane protein